jgi:undecaprenyl phosphate-alpha-L-ara4FN deformylase
MSISIAVHVDGYYGLKYGVRNMLDLFDKYNIKASFFINMGKEAGIFKILKYYGGSEGSTGSTKSTVGRYTKFQILRMLFFPKNLGNSNCEILEEIKRKGHEVNPHCWSHIMWSKNFNNLNIPEQFSKMCNAFDKCVHERPIGFVPPTWKWDVRVINEMKNFKLKYLSVNEGKMQWKDGILIIPLTFEKTPEELLNQGLGEEKILKIYEKEIKGKKFVNLYFHADFEGIAGIKLFEKILKLVNPKEIKMYQEIYSKENEK